MVNKFKKKTFFPNTVINVTHVQVRSKLFHISTSLTLHSWMQDVKMPIGNVSKVTAARRDSFRPPWVKDKDAEAPPAWTQKKLKPVESTTKTMDTTSKSIDEPTPKSLKRESKYKVIFFTYNIQSQKILYSKYHFDQHMLYVI